MHSLLQLRIPGHSPALPVPFYFLLSVAVSEYRLGDHDGRQGGRSLALLSSSDSAYAVGTWHQGRPCFSRLGEGQDFLYLLGPICPILVQKMEHV